MRKLIAIVMVTLSLGGCAQLSAVGSGLSLVTKTITNPVTEQELYAIEATARILVEALLTYRRACIAGSADKSCRVNIEAIQPYTRQIKPLGIPLGA
jgi:hypothetical protein